MTNTNQSESTVRQKKDKWMQIRIDPATKAAWAAQAAKEEKTLSAWICEKLNGALG